MKNQELTRQGGVAAKDIRPVNDIGTVSVKPIMSAKDITLHIYIYVYNVHTIGVSKGWQTTVVMAYGDV